MLSLAKPCRKLHIQKGILRLTMFIGGIFLLIGTAVTPTFADSPVVTGTITAGSLSETASTNYSFTGTPGSTVSFTMPFTANDFTGARAGWNLSITSTTFTGTAGTLPNDASTITGTTAACSTAGTCSDATLTNNVVGSVGLPAGTTAPTPVKFFGTATSTASGTYVVTPTISVVLPGGLKAGTLASTMTLTIAAGP